MSAARADVRVNHLRRGVDIYVSPQPGRILAWGDVTNEAADEAVAPAAQHVLNLPDDVARALYEALNRYYGGSDAGTARKDYEAERARVDRLLDHLISPPVSTYAPSPRRDILPC